MQFEQKIEGITQELEKVQSEHSDKISEKDQVGTHFKREMIMNKVVYQWCWGHWVVLLCWCAITYMW